MGKVVVFLADGCEEIEALTVIDILRRGNVDVIGASINDTLGINGAHNIDFKANVTFNDINFDDVDMIVLPGGYEGRNNLLAHDGVCKVCQDFMKKNKYIAAICAAPSILGENRILEGKRATCYPGFENQLKGANYTDKALVIDGNIITSKGPATAMLFSIAQLEVMTNTQTAAKVAQGLLFKF